VKRAVLIRTAAVASTIALTVSGQADPDQYANFTKDDARITDKYTHLVWERQDSPVIADAATIDAYCAGNTRLPTVKELLTLFDETPTKTYDPNAQKTIYVHIDQDAFSNFIGYVSIDAPYCTQTKSPSGGGRFVVDFGTGTALPNSAPCHVRCVRYAP
jgi:hypothetical protein